MSFTLEGRTGPWEIVVGLEVHAQVTSRAKLFSGAATDFGAAPNSQVSFVDAGFPGMLPVINRECVAQAVRTGLGLNAQVNLWSRFDRKNYFYADLPQGYQISQFAHPIIGTGEVEITLADGSTKTIGITRLHLEQDAGKSLHDQHPTKSFIDLNLPLPHDRALVLGDLIALRQVGIEIILAVEDAAQIDLRLQPQAGARRLSHALAVDHRQHARHRRVDERDVRVGLAAERS